MLIFDDRTKIVFTGDSVTDAGRGRPVGEGLWDGVGSGFVRDIDTMLNVYYPEKLIHIANTGISGNTSQNLLDRIKPDLLDLAPDYAVICIGFNDVWRQFDTPALVTHHILPEQFEKNICAIIEAVKDNVRKLIFLTPYYMEPLKEDAMRARMDEYGTIVKKCCEKYDVQCIDLQKEFDEYLKYRHSSFIMWDRVHPGHVGSMIIARAFLRETGFDRQLV